jgi:hypothetical protein
MSDVEDTQTQFSKSIPLYYYCTRRCFTGDNKIRHMEDGNNTLESVGLCRTSPWQDHVLSIEHRKLGI